jgi:hypothetical protein
MEIIHLGLRQTWSAQAGSLAFGKGPYWIEAEMRMVCISVIHTSTSMRQISGRSRGADSIIVTNRDAIHVRPSRIENGFQRWGRFDSPEKKAVLGSRLWGNMGIFT